MKKIIIVDVGTHVAQEYKAIFANKIYIFFIVIKQFFLQRFFKIGSSINISQLNEILHYRKNIQLFRDKIKCVFIEPNPFVVNSIYKEADLFIPCALDSYDGMRFCNLYLSRGNIKGQGNSIYRNTSNLGYLTVLASSAKLVAQKIKDTFEVDNVSVVDYKVILRINCEGSEDDVIYAFENIFGRHFIAVLGALKDVEEIKGKDALVKLENFMQSKDIKFLPFTPSASTWPKAMNFLNDLLNQ